MASACIWQRAYPPATQGRSLGGACSLSNLGGCNSAWDRAQSLRLSKHVISCSGQFKRVQAASKKAHRCWQGRWQIHRSLKQAPALHRWLAAGAPLLLGPPDPLHAGKKHVSGQVPVTAPLESTAHTSRMAALAHRHTQLRMSHSFQLEHGEFPLGE